MGTRSRLVIRRHTKPTIHLWMHWDGYFCGQGDQICKQIFQLLQQFSEEEVEAKVEALKVEDGAQTFDAKDLGDFIVGNKVFYNDTCEDVEYEYVLDFRRRVLVANSFNSGECILLTFEQLRNGHCCSEFEDCLDD